MSGMQAQQNDMGGPGDQINQQNNQQNNQMDWGGGGGAARSGGMAPSFAQSAQPQMQGAGSDYHPGSAIGLAPPGGKPDIGISAPSAPASTPWGGAGASAQGMPGMQAGAGTAGNTAWGAPQGQDQSQESAAAQPAPANQAGGWTSGWGGEGGQNVPLKSSDSWAVPGSESTNSWGQPSDGTNVSMEMPNPAAMAGGAQASGPAPGPAASGWGSTSSITAAGTDAWGRIGGRKRSHCRSKRAFLCFRRQQHGYQPTCQRAGSRSGK